MGNCQSYLEKRNQENLRVLETINKSIDNIRLLEKEEKRQQDLLILQRNKIILCIKEEQLKLNELKKKHSLTLETIKLFECNICMENLNKKVCVPCGHCFCEKCSISLEECPICRQKVDSIISIYFN